MNSTDNPFRLLIATDALGANHRRCALSVTGALFGAIGRCRALASARTRRGQTYVSPHSASTAPEPLIVTIRQQNAITGRCPQLSKSSLELARSAQSASVDLGNALTCPD